MAKKVLIFRHAISPQSGGMEKNWYQIIEYLNKKNWEIHLVSFSFETNIRLKNVRHYKVPGGCLKPDFFKVIWFLVYGYFFYLFNKKLSSESIITTCGVEFMFPQVLQLPFIHGHWQKIVKQTTFIQLPILRKFELFLLCQIEKLQFKLVNKRRSKVIAISKTMQNYLSTQVELTSEIIHNNGEFGKLIIDTKKEFNKETDLKLIFVGTFKRKGLEKVLDIASKLKCHEFTFRTNVFGNGDIHIWNKKIQNRELSKQVFLHGHTKEIQKEFLDSHILIFPSYYEPFGLVIYEAALCGCFPLASQESGAMELFPLIDKKLKLSAHDHPDRWCEAIFLLNQPDFFMQQMTYIKNCLNSWSNHSMCLAYEKILNTESEQLYKKM